MLTIFRPISHPVPTALAEQINDRHNICSSNAFVSDKTRQNTWLRSSLKIVKCGSVSDNLTTLCSHHESVLRAHTPKNEEAGFVDIDQISSEELEYLTDHQSKWRRILGGLIVGGAVVAGIKLFSVLKEVTIPNGLQDACFLFARACTYLAHSF